MGGISGIWKDVLDSLDIIRGGLAWKIGNGNDVKFSIDPWPRRNQSLILSNALVEWLDLNNYRFLSEVRDESTTSIFSQGWKSSLILGLSVAHCKEWNRYVEALQGVDICLCEEVDVLVWDKSMDGKHSPKVGYSSICV